MQLSGTTSGNQMQGPEFTSQYLGIEGGGVGAVLKKIGN